MRAITLQGIVAAILCGCNKDDREHSTQTQDATVARYIYVDHRAVNISVIKKQPDHCRLMATSYDIEQSMLPGDLISKLEERIRHELPLMLSPTNDAAGGGAGITKYSHTHSDSGDAIIHEITWVIGTDLVAINVRLIQPRDQNRMLVRIIEYRGDCVKEITKNYRGLSSDSVIVR